MTKSTLAFLLCLGCFAAVAQTNTEAYKLGVEGVLKVDNGEYKEGISLLKKARNLEPQDYDFAFEIGKAYLKSGNPKMAEKYLFPLQYHTQVQADLYLLLAQCYYELDDNKRRQIRIEKKS